jgi:hypothetical protein
MGSDPKLVRIRLVGREDLIAPMAAKLVGDLEKEGMLVLEWSQAFPCRYPEEDKSRIHISARVTKTEGEA